MILFFFWCFFFLYRCLAPGWTPARSQFQPRDSRPRGGGGAVQPAFFPQPADPPPEVVKRPAAQAAVKCCFEGGGVGLSVPYCLTPRWVFRGGGGCGCHPAKCRWSVTQGQPPRCRLRSRWRTFFEPSPCGCPLWNPPFSGHLSNFQIPCSCRGFVHRVSRYVRGRREGCKQKNCSHGASVCLCHKRLSRNQLSLV